MISIPAPLFAYLKKVAARRGTTVAEVIRGIIADHMEGQKQK
jgi:hypothetical protein